MRTASHTAISATSAGTHVGATGTFLLHFPSLFHTGRDFAFPCDEHGRVDLNDMNARVRNNYLYARAMLGREFAWPAVRCVDAHDCPANAPAAS